jgi:hypothetical protein
VTSKKDRRAPGSGGKERRDRRAAKSSAAKDAEARRVASLKNSTHSKVGFDAKGNPVLEWRTTEPARRADDDTIDYLKCLDSDALEIADESDGAKPKRRPKGYNPYDKS